MTPQFSIRGQYVKDISFENPKAPEVFALLSQKPGIEINIDIEIRRLEEALYEVTLSISAKASAGGEGLFMITLDYAGLFAIEGFLEKDIEPLLWIECPTILFPYARRIISDLTRDGGYTSLMIDPVDFGMLYEKRKEALAKAETKTGTA